jgi:glutamate N-acetyltransferase/amino-acid N-acetyltransferase
VFIHKEISMSGSNIINTGICVPEGFKAAGVACGLKADGRLDLCVIAAEQRCAAAATFTTNAFRAAPVSVTMDHLRKDGYLQAVVVNSGNANAWTGARGMEDARAMAELVAGNTGVDKRDVAVASTGAIGIYLDMDSIAGGIAEAASCLDRGGSGDAARAIMTTDTRPKEVAWDHGSFRIGGMAKGAGMIKPDMATMLAFITTDAAVTPEQLSGALRKTVDMTFNRITIDGCTSTNDMVIALASGASGAEPEPEELEEALLQTCSALARSIVEDGEGATKLIAVRVHEAADAQEAQRAAVTVAESALVKTALFGGDPNWGRIVQALGQAVKDLDPGKVKVRIGGVTAAAGGEPAEVDMGSLEDAVAGREIGLDIFLGRGGAALEILTCDYSYDYVKINAEYHS